MPDFDADTKPWKESARQRLRRRIPGLPTSFEDRLLLIGVVLVAIDGLHVLREFSSDLIGFVAWPFILLQWLFTMFW